MKALLLALALVVGCSHAPPAPDGMLTGRDMPARLYCVASTADSACVLFRSAQPTAGDFVALRDRLNVRTVVKLNRPSLIFDGPVDQVPDGVKLVRRPLWPAGPLEHDDLMAAVDALDECIAPLSPGSVSMNDGRVVFADGARPAGAGACLLHCEHGVDRTGVVVALWRVRHGSAPFAAYAEWRAFGRDESLVLLTRAFERETGWRAP